MFVILNVSEISLGSWCLGFFYLVFSNIVHNLADLTFKKNSMRHLQSAQELSDELWDAIIYFEDDSELMKPFSEFIYNQSKCEIRVYDDTEDENGENGDNPHLFFVYAGIIIKDILYNEYGQWLLSEDARQQRINNLIKSL